MVSLTSARLPSSPQDFFIHCASLVTELEIEKQDYYGDFAFSSNDSWLRKFENEVSAHIGKDDAIFLPSGVMAQNIALKIAQENCAVMNNNKILCHYTSHLLNHEHNSYEFLLRMQAYITPLGPDLNRVDQRPLSWEDVKPYLDLPEAQRPHTLIVELPHREIGGKCTSWEDLQKMSIHCRSNRVAFHMDGARLWEASAADSYNTHSLKELCSLFDSIYVSFYKGLGGVSGAMLVSSRSNIEKARIWSRRLGGNIFSIMPLAVSCWHGFRSNHNTFENRKQRLITIVRALTHAFCEITSPSDCMDPSTTQPLLRFDPPVPETSMIHVYVRADTATATQVRDTVLKETGVSCFGMARPAQQQLYVESNFELNLGPGNYCIPDEVWLNGWETYVKALRQVLMQIS